MNTVRCHDDEDGTILVERLRPLKDPQRAALSLAARQNASAHHKMRAETDRKTRAGTGEAPLRTFERAHRTIRPDAVDWKRRALGPLPTVAVNTFRKKFATMPLLGVFTLSRRAPEGGVGRKGWRSSSGGLTSNARPFTRQLKGKPRI